jgi:hypothetical protein
MKKLSAFLPTLCTGCTVYSKTTFDKTGDWVNIVYLSPTVHCPLFKILFQFLMLIICLKHFIQHCFICCLSDSTVLEDTGIGPRTVATLALAAYLFSDKYEVTLIKKKLSSYVRKYSEGSGCKVIND